MNRLSEEFVRTTDEMDSSSAGEDEDAGQVSDNEFQAVNIRIIPGPNGQETLEIQDTSAEDTDEDDDAKNDGNDKDDDEEVCLLF